ncbi:preprotein translocase subunit SecE [Siccirubricoccus sp. KC 17139]|uniref:Preprotein translocase subunit SecE n=1 Tax=Siccirubricoccus soli TaxID=2899147 RepID=A0ABT1DB12_9PROT|nr:preprotein translocase subunit SecE [Siccirubricoccus soli]MCO6419128.1 preprotein translocase subunit SecE [Siccirubricoccus soli]MCP2685263.1 preprotein translocase subunit SecE [Siccirubricoccus soli]
MAEHQQHYEFAAVDSKDILAEREQGWEGFTQFITWGIGITVLVLLALLLFVA